MPVVITDHTNKTWAVEDPRDGLIHVGWSGKPGPRLDDVLEFLDNRERQFSRFVAKKRIEEIGPEIKRRGARGRSSRGNEEEISASQSSS